MERSRSRQHPQYDVATDLPQLKLGRIRRCCCWI